MTKISITIGNDVVMATLDDSAAAHDFAALLPLTVTLTDYKAIEKISDLPRRLSKSGAPAGFQPSPGHITYYAPWGNIAIFYRDFGYAPGLVSLGRINTGLDVLARRGALEATLARAEAGESAAAIDERRS